VAWTLSQQACIATHTARTSPCRQGLAAVGRACLKTGSSSPLSARAAPARQRPGLLKMSFRPAPGPTAPGLETSGSCLTASVRRQRGLRGQPAAHAGTADCLLALRSSTRSGPHPPVGPGNPQGLPLQPNGFKPLGVQVLLTVWRGEWRLSQPRPRVWAAARVSPCAAVSTALGGCAWPSHGPC
jgi:hypothetical protein